MLTCKTCRHWYVPSVGGLHPPCFHPNQTLGQCTVPRLGKGAGSAIAAVCEHDMEFGDSPYGIVITDQNFGCVLHQPLRGRTHARKKSTGRAVSDREVTPPDPKAIESMNRYFDHMAEHGCPPPAEPEPGHIASVEEMASRFDARFPLATRLPALPPEPDPPADRDMDLLMAPAYGRSALAVYDEINRRIALRVRAAPGEAAAAGSEENAMTKFSYPGHTITTALADMLAHDSGEAGREDGGNPALRAAVRQHLDSMDDDWHRRFCARFARAFLVETSIAGDYGIEDVVEFAGWLERLAGEG